MPRPNRDVAPLDVPKPASEPDKGGEAIHISRIYVEDVPPELQLKVNEIVMGSQGQELTLNELRGVAARISEVMINGGEALSYAMIPPQKVKDGVIRMVVVHGHLERVALGKNNSRVSDAVLERYLRHAGTPEGDLKPTQIGVARLADLPGVGAVEPVLSAGETPGGSVMTVDVGATPMLSTALFVDNTGSTVTGRNRMGVQFTVNSPLKIGDRFQVVGYAAPDIFQFNTDSNGGYTLLGRASYDLPIGVGGARAGFAAARVNYALGGVYREKGDGIANTFSLYASQPLLRESNQELSLNATVDYKTMRDSTLGDSNKRSDIVGGVQLSGSRSGTLIGLPNAIQVDVGAAAGRIYNPSKFYGRDSNGMFYKAMENAHFTQVLPLGVLLDVNWSGQQASQGLDSVEKFTLAGPTAVRGYSSDIPSADSGWVASVALSAPVPKVTGLRAQVFYDRARGNLRKFAPPKVDPIINLSGWGVGLNYTVNNRASMSLSYARPINGQPLGARPSGMVWVNAGIKI
ncbi:ShlB/FhaC/HecB family hemolysin secretion/activation protein [Paraburkholderia hayleyella]|uniref:ShlB/FhaC/HecB family hemolysin secretion/activation protein n=1 Tax=Paraburkholderia hayleyella TaxID=2152889 RepID=UPI001C65B768|nr:ShlB/FhaC/HecB family hemolysin secretion/activation protein [Paraburkholderia hayleyella]